VFTKALKYQPPGAGLPVKDTLVLEREAFVDLYDIKRGNPLAKSQRELEIILPRSSALGEMLASVGVAAGTKRGLGGSAPEDTGADRPEQLDYWEPVALVPVTKKSQGRKSVDRKLAALQLVKLPGTVLCNAAVPTKKVSEVGGKWAGAQVEGLFSIYLVGTHLAVGLLPAITLNLGLAVGLCIPFSVLCMPAKIGGGIGGMLHEAIVWVPHELLSSIKVLVSEAVYATLPRKKESVASPAVTYGHEFYNDLAAQVAATVTTTPLPCINQTVVQPAPAPTPMIIHHRPQPPSDSMWRVLTITSFVSTIAILWWGGRATP